MSGIIKTVLDDIINGRSVGDPVIAEMTKAKLILKGINPDNFDSCSEDDPEVLKKVFVFANQLLTPPSENYQYIRSAFSEKGDEQAVALDIKRQLDGLGAKVLIFFASTSYNQKDIGHYLQQAFNNSIVFGCSTAGEITAGKMSKNSVSAIAMSQKVIQSAKVEVVNLNDINASVDAAFSSFENFFSESSHTMDTEQYIGIVLIDGVSMQEEMLMDLIGNRTNVLFTGGAAGDDMKFIRTYVSALGGTFENSAVLALLKIDNNTEFSIIKTQSFSVTDKTLTANKVCENGREVIEFNGKPATEAYAEALGVSEIDLPDYFSKNPVGIKVGANDIFVRSPREIIGTNIKFYCNILRGETVHLLESSNIIEDTRAVLIDKKRELGHIDGLIDFDCILRTKELERLGKTQQYADLFKNMQMAGFSTYGEEYIGHINQTSTMIAFKVNENYDIKKFNEIDNLTRNTNNKSLEDENHMLLIENAYLQKKLKSVISTLKEFNCYLDKEIHERSKREHEIEYLSYHDILTGMFNRRFYNDVLKKIDTIDNLPITIVMGDVNGLKIINDSFGHEKGDELLKIAAKGMIKACREDDIAVRWGGDEFILLMPRTSKDEAYKIVREICNEYKTKVVENLRVSVSFGVATKMKLEEEIGQILQLAEDRMYEKKYFEGRQYNDSVVTGIRKSINERHPMEVAHARMVSELSEKTGRAMGLPEFEVRKLKAAGLLHDVGKIAINDDILTKAGVLSDEEWREIKRHPDVGCRILSSSTSFRDIGESIKSHHERWDGKGYPNGLKGEEIPVVARIVFIAGSYSAMVFKPPYGKGFDNRQAVAEIRKNVGKQFDSEIARIFVEQVLGEEWE